MRPPGSAQPSAGPSTGSSLFAFRLPVIRKLPLLLPAAALAFLTGLSWLAGEFEAVAEPIDETSDRVGFLDVSEAVGLRYPLAIRSERESSGEVRENKEDGGLALVDIDGDGRLELYVAHGGGEVGRLFDWEGHRFARRAGNGGIAPATLDRAGYFIDLDDDGAPDFLSVQAEGTQAFRNDGAGRFEEAPDLIGGIRQDRHVYSMAASDYDGDGDLDLFFAHWSRPWNGVRPPAGYLWRNDGKGRYEDVSHIVPIRPTRPSYSSDVREHSFTPTFTDIDGDGDPDILLTGDFRASQVLRNEAGAAFSDITGATITDENGMGAAVGDYDHDGDMDWFVTSIHDADGTSGYGRTGNRLYRNMGDGLFEDVTEAAGVREGGWGWGTCLADFDNDSYQDVFHTNGWFGEYVEDAGGESREITKFLQDSSRLFMSNGDGTFSERAAALGMRHTGQGRGVVCADYDSDGRVDILIANHGAAPAVYRNVFETGNRWIAIDLAGRYANPLGIGARVTVTTASGAQVQEMRLGGSYLSQPPPTLHFGLGGNSIVRSVEVQWPGPGNQVSRLEDVAIDRSLTISQPALNGFLLSVVRGTGTGLHRPGVTVPIEAETGRGHYRFSHWSGEGGGKFDDVRAPQTSFTMPAGPATVIAHFLPGPPSSTPNVSVARRWIEVLLQAIRNDRARPTVQARNLFHLSAAMYDAWAAWSETASPYHFGEDSTPCGPAPSSEEDVRSAQEEAISHAAWRLIRHRFRHSPGAAKTLNNADTLKTALGHDTQAGTADTAAALGACIGDFYIARGLEDGSNEANDYASTFYEPVNSDLPPAAPGNPGLDDPDRWQSLDLEHFVDQSGFVEDTIPEFVTPEWGLVTPFALSDDNLTVYRRDGGEYHVYHDPGPPPTLRGPLAEHYKWGFALVGRWSAQLSPDDDAMMDIAPSGIGNIPFLPQTLEDYPAFYDAALHGPGHELNPATGEPYELQIVPRGDYARVLAEFWADGPDSETPPGHWFVILNSVNDHERLVRRRGGEGALLDPLEWDVKSYFSLGGAMHDAAITSWGIKGWYDYIRPISALRFMADRGQSSDPSLPSWSANGIPLVEGFIELVGPDDTLAGAAGAHVGKIKLRAWRGPDFVDDPATDAAGVSWVLAENWWPYQRPSFVTPPFAGYVSGHSTFSRAAAEVLTLFTGDPFFPDGMSDFRIPANEFLVFERGPSVDMVLQWATYRDAADQCSLSRIWGGIHPPADDIPGRLIGARVGRDAFRLSESYFLGRTPGP